MTFDRFVTPMVLFTVAFFVVFLPAERSRDFSSTMLFLAGFLTTVGIYAIFVLALNVQWGYTGVFNFGVAAFFMVGAYTAAIVTKGPDQSEFQEYWGGFGDFLSPDFLGAGEWLPFLVAILAAGLASGILALLLALPTLRLRQDYLAIATIGVAELLRRVVIEEEYIVNGARSLPGIPSPLEGYFNGSDYRYVYLGLVLVVLLIVFVAVERGIRSPWGRVLRALREDELATSASGKNVFAFKMQGFVFGAIIMGVGGAVFAFSRRSVGPETFDHFFATFLFWAMLIAGGSGNNKGAIAGAFFIWGIWTITLQVNAYDLPDAIRSRIFFFRDFTIGSLIVIILLLRPQGLFPEERRVSIWLDRRMRRGGPSPPEKSAQERA